MKKHLLSLAFAIPFSSAVMAQSEIISSVGSSPLKCEMMARTPAVTAGEGQVWWSNYDLDATVRYIDGTEVAEHYDLAVFIPTGLVTKGDATIDGFSFFPQTSEMDNVTVWVSKSLPGGDVDKLETVAVDKEAIELNKFNDVAFVNHHALPVVGGLYVGMSFDIKKLSDTYARRPFSYTNTGENRKNSFYYRTTSLKSWTAVDGNAYVKVLLGGGHFSKYAVKVNDFATNYVVKGGSVSVPVTVRSMGTDTVESISYVITTDGVPTEETTKAVKINGFQNSKTVSLNFAADELTRTYQKQLTITKVNGMPNDCADNTAKGTLITVSEKFDSKPVVEVFTSTKGIYCPNAIVSIEKAKEQLGDKAVILAVHYNDVMQIDDYKDILYNVTSIPSSFINREYEVYPSPTYFVKTIEGQLDRIVPAKIDLKAEWTGNEVSPVNIALSSTTTFCYDDYKANYGIAYVLVADGLEGTGSDWEQANGFSGDSGTDALKFWYDAPAKVSGMVYDNVPVAAWDIFSGAKNSVPSSVKNGQAIAHNQTVNIKNNKLIQDKDKLTAVALLIDRSNNQIVNAAQTAITKAGQGIDNNISDDDNTVVARYDLAGRKAAASQRGLSIVKLANGKSLKIVR